MGEGVFLGQLQAFLEIARLGSLTRAADSLFLTQPALTSRLKRLERELGAALLVRDRKGARLTDAGRAFLPYAEAAVAAMTQGQRTIYDVSHGLTGDLVIAATPMMSTYILPPVVSAFVTAHPEVRLRMRSGPSDQVLEMVLRGVVQLGLGGSLQNPDIEVTPLFEEEFILAVDKKHPLASQEQVLASDLERYNLIGLSTTAMHQELIDALKSRGVRPKSMIDTDNPETSKQLVLQGAGIGMFSRTSLRSDLAAGTVVEIHILDVPPLFRTIGASRLRHASELTVVAEFLGLLGKRLRELGLRLGKRRSSDRRRAQRDGEERQTGPRGVAEIAVRERPSAIRWGRGDRRAQARAGRAG